MVNTLIRTYMDVQQARERLEAADRPVLAAYKRYQHTLMEFGPTPTHGWWRVLVAQEHQPFPKHAADVLQLVGLRRSLVTP
jgi:hypothetical protein